MLGACLRRQGEEEEGFYKITIPVTNLPGKFERTTNSTGSN